MLNLDINIITPSEKFIEAFRLIKKVFLGADSNKSLKYTFEKIHGIHLAILNLFRGAY